MIYDIDMYNNVDNELNSDLMQLVFQGLKGGQ
jgi:hypothetical protein